MLARGVTVSAGTDATRVASYNPWVSLAWLITGETVGGLRITPPHQRLDRETALRMWTEKVAWFSDEVDQKGRIEEGQLADLTVPDRDFFGCAESEIAGTTALLTMVGGKVVYASGEFQSLDESDVPPAMPDWSPVRRFGGYGAGGEKEGSPLQAALRRQAMANCACNRDCHVHGHDHAAAASGRLPVSDLKSFWGALGCACWSV
jgi:hypothetical protein